ncbi:hypothetical protein Celaphus_00015406 [Cervus elaphus hippelaphus]|uniref:G-protein coupled receptors family 1 profile domain-containing protein n=1 Tax=Cervus elaphus hippelaphus TaxID=46360 RepID=A0A212CSN1_CEREH|nr:hypothetical protein Celaphus_00015406 [Cervus elaphus hippelaphus]
MPKKLQGLRKEGLQALKISLAVFFTNAFVLTAVSKTRKFYIPANYFIGSLAMTDLLVSILVMFISITYTTTHIWSFGHLLCDIWSSSDITWYQASILETRTVGHAAARLAIIWATSIHISIPPLLWQQAKAHEEISACLVNTSQFSYIIFSFCGAFSILPVLLIILCGQIYMAAWNHILNPLSLYGKCFTTAQLIRDSAGSLLCSLNASLHEGHSHLTVFWSTRGFLLPETGKPRKAWGSIQGASIICWLPFFAESSALLICQCSCWAHPALLTFSLGKAI